MVIHKTTKFLITYLFFLITVLVINGLLAKAFHNKENELSNLKNELLITQEEDKILLDKLNKIQSDIKKEKEAEIKKAKKDEENIKIVKAYVTAFNTTVSQTDGNPCQAKFGYICGRDDVVACPRNIPPNTKVKILGKEYECMDWTALKYNGRFDISFDKDISEAIQFGKKYLSITILYE